MPIDVDEDERREAIAQPTLAFASTVEEPSYWTQERAARVARVVVDALVDG
ncbi:hypothetical protein [Streptomyces flaveolus]|uniref:hypothetical protein n=1 Tax=Streptomyces flaveolus TaxID=67297 RepID=UPI003321E2B1